MSLARLTDSKLVYVKVLSDDVILACSMRSGKPSCVKISLSEKKVEELPQEESEKYVSEVLEKFEKFEERVTQLYREVDSEVKKMLSEIESFTLRIGESIRKFLRDMEEFLSLQEE